MSSKNKKQFGVWMDSRHATIAGREHVDSGDWVVLGHVNDPGPDRNSNENAANNQEISLTHKFFKQIAAKMTNVEEVHVTGTGQVQEQFIKFLADTPQFKHAATSESTSNKMDDAQLLTYMTKQFN